MANPQNLKPFTGADDPRRSKGRVKGVLNSKTRYLKLLNIIQKVKHPITDELGEFTVIEQLDMQMIAKALKGDLSAYREILDRLEGKPAPTNEAPGELSVKFEVVNRVPDSKELPPK